jgi:RNA polymerase sigma-70 factor (ECF subfamily)
MEQSEIVKGCINGDRKCQNIIYERMYGKMLGICMRYSRDKDEALDVLQDGFIKVFLKIKQYEGTGPFEGWVRKIIVNTALDNIRRTKNTIRHVSDSLIEDNGEETDDIEKSEGYQDELGDYMDISKEEIMAAVQQMSPSYRAVFNMHIVEGFQHAEIAEQLGIKEGTSKSHLFRARAFLKKKLQKHLIQVEI